MREHDPRAAWPLATGPDTTAEHAARDAKESHPGRRDRPRGNPPIKGTCRRKGNTGKAEVVITSGKGRWKMVAPNRRRWFPAPIPTWAWDKGHGWRQRYRGTNKRPDWILDADGHWREETKAEERARKRGFRVGARGQKVTRHYYSTASLLTRERERSMYTGQGFRGKLQD